MAQRHNGSNVRTADLVLSNLLRQVSNGSFRKAATQRLVLRPTATMSRLCRPTLRAKRAFSAATMNVPRALPANLRRRPRQWQLDSPLTACHALFCSLALPSQSGKRTQLRNAP